MENESAALIEISKAETPGHDYVARLSGATATPGAVARFASADSSQGERRLLTAILQDALYCYQKHIFAKKARERRIFREVQRWFNVRETDAPLSFEYICQALSIDPDYFRRGLRRWRIDQLVTPEVPRRQRRSPRQASIGSRGGICLSRLTDCTIRAAIGDETHNGRLADHKAARTREDPE